MLPMGDAQRACGCCLPHALVPPPLHTKHYCMTDRVAWGLARSTRLAIAPLYTVKYCGTCIFAGWGVGCVGHCLLRFTPASILPPFTAIEHVLSGSRMTRNGHGVHLK